MGFLVCMLLSPQQFFVAYAKFFYYYAWLSLAFYGFGVLFPNFILTLPTAYNDAGTGYRHLFIYFYQGLDSWNYRNAGLFWEGGAYGMFLFFALLMSLCLGLEAKIIIVIFFSILTTGSTTAIAASVLIILASNRFGARQKFYSFLIFFSLSPLASDILIDIFISKFSGENISYLDRSVGMAADLRLFASSPLFGLGFSEYNSEFNDIAISLGAFAPTSSNSFTGLLAVFGGFYTTLIFFPILFLYVKQSSNGFQAVVIGFAVIVMYSSQGLVYFPLSYVFLFYGVRAINGARITDFSSRKQTLGSWKA
jgi:hypothetical protein